MSFFVVSGGLDLCRLRPAEGDSRIRSNVRVARKERITSSQRSLSDMQIARIVLSEVNDKNALCCRLPLRANGDLDKGGYYPLQGPLTLERCVSHLRPYV